MLMTSFKDSQEAIATTQTIFPKEWTFEHYQDIFNAEIFPFIMYFKNSLVISLIASVTAVVIGISGAYALSKLRFKARSKINASFYTVYMFSGILIVVPLFKIISGLGLYDTNTALIITMVVQTLPTAIFMLKSYFDTIPTDIEEAAMIDGLSRIRSLFGSLYHWLFLESFLSSFIALWFRGMIIYLLRFSCRPPKNLLYQSV